MKTYYFYDSDWNYGGRGDVEYDIKGAEFRTLLEVCCRYSTHAAFAFCPLCDRKYREFLSPFEMPMPDAVSPKDYPTSENNDEPFTKPSFNRVYRTCPELVDALCAISDSIFTYLDGWGYCHPEDPTFYRADGSVFFSSTIHEGECRLTPHDNEDVSQIIANPLWVCYD